MDDVIRIEPDHDLPGWLPLVAWLLAIPHLLWLGLLQVVAGLALIPAFVIVIVTGKVPQGIARLQILTLRQRARTYSRFWVLRADHPPFATALSAADPGDDDRVAVSATIPSTVPRAAPIVRPILAVPHALVLVPIAIVMDLLYPIWMIVAAFGRGWSPTAADRLVRVEQWAVALLLWVTLASDERPAFGLAAQDDAPPATIAPAAGG